jgi:inosose dehydratase
MEQQFQALAAMGVRYADITDSHDGATLGTEYGFSASVSLDSHPAKIRAMAAAAGITLTSLCAHANLLDPPAPDVYSTNEIIKAIRLAALLGIHHVITTEGDPKTAFGHALTPAERLFAIREKLQTPIQWAEELGIEVLIEPHGIVTDAADQLEALLDALGHEKTVGICLDTGNSWLGGGEPLDFIRRFGSRIKHVHWKDMAAEWIPLRGSVFGCGMATIALGDGVVGIPAIVDALAGIGFDCFTTLEIAGERNVLESIRRLTHWSAPAAGNASH